MDNPTQTQLVAGRDTHRTAMIAMLAIFGGSLIGGAVLLTAFFELTRF